MDKPAAGVRALLLDFDGTLVDSRAAGDRAWTTWAERNGYDPRPFLELHGATGVDRFLQCAPRVDPDRELAWIVAHELQDTSGIVARPGAREALTGPWPVAIVTSATRRLVLGRLHAADLPMPKVMVTADDVRSGKPSPEPYLKAAERLGCSRDMCDVLEDAPLGVKAGRAAGMRVFGVLGTVDRDELGDAQHIVRDPKEYLRRFRPAEYRRFRT